MTRTALRREPAAPPARAGLRRLDDSELLDLVRSEPIGSALRSDACEVLVMRHEALVRSCVLRYSGSPESAEELMQVLLEVRQASADLAQQLGRSPADAELARHLGVSDADLLEARRADLFFHAPSLDAPLPRTEGMARLADLLGEEDPRLALTVDMDAVNAHWTELPARERRILLMRFYGNMTQAEIGARLGISQMHVSRLQATALSYLRDRLLGQDPAAAPSPPSGSPLTQTRRQA